MTVEQNDIEAGLARMKSHGMNMGDAAILLIRTFGINLSQAKQLLHNSPSWVKEVQDIAPLLNAFHEIVSSEHSTKAESVVYETKANLHQPWQYYLRFQG